MWTYRNNIQGVRKFLRVILHAKIMVMSCNKHLKSKYLPSYISSNIFFRLVCFLLWTFNFEYTDKKMCFVTLQETNMLLSV